MNGLTIEALERARQAMLRPDCIISNQREIAVFPLLKQHEHTRTDPLSRDCGLKHVHVLGYDCVGHNHGTDLPIESVAYWYRDGPIPDGWVRWGNPPWKFGPGEYFIWIRRVETG